MKLSSGAEHGKKEVPRASAVFWLFCLLVCYQAGYQVYMTFVLGQDAIALDPWCNGSQGSSAQQCVEAQLFRGWQSDTQDKMNDLLQVHPHTLRAPPADVTALPAATTAKPNAAEANPTSLDEDAPVEKPEPPAGITPFSKSLVAIQQKYEERFRARQEHHLHAAHLTLQEAQNMSSLSQDLKALHDRFDTRLAERRAHTQEAKDEFRNLTKWANDVQAQQQHLQKDQPTSAPQEDDMTPWSHDLETLQHRMEVRMAAHDKTHRALDALDARVEAHKNARLEGLEGHSHAHTILEEIAALGKQMCSDAKHRGDPKCAQFLTADAAPVSTTTHGNLRYSKRIETLDQAEAQLNHELHDITEKQEVWEKSFVARVSDTMQEFCSDPIHSTQKTCIQFHKDHAAHEVADAAAQKQAWHAKFAKKISNVGHDLCSNPMRRNYAICKKILGEEEAAAKTGQENVQASKDAEAPKEAENDDKAGNANNTSSRKRLDLQWSPVTQWEQQTSKGLRGAKLPTGVKGVVNIDEAEATNLRRSSHWTGRIPTAACITLVPSGDTAKAWLSYFIDNFRLQNYEGSHQLVLVYHHSDHDVAALVHKYVDGTYIKSAEARGEEFPSAAAFRFGAWLARDADVIARWDFGAWHHPQRLSMQVRALAQSGRPAGILKRWTVLDKVGDNTTERTEQDGERWESSLVGEAAWMRKNWYPYLKEERAVWDAHEDRDVVKLDVPGLEVFDEAARW